MRGAIFDVDGTLLDSMQMWWDLIMDYFHEHGVDITYDEAAVYKDMTLDESLPVIIEKLRLDTTIEKILRDFQERAADRYAHSIPLKDGAYEYVHSLHDAGIKIAVATSGYEELCRSAFSRLGILDCIDAFAFSSEVGVNKSNPDIYLLAAKRIGVDPSECVVYEDITAGIIGASKGGFKTCAVYDKASESETDKLLELSDRYIKSWRELL